MRKINARAHRIERAQEILCILNEERTAELYPSPGVQQRRIQEDNKEGNISDPNEYHKTASGARVKKQKKVTVF